MSMIPMVVRTFGPMMVGRSDRGSRRAAGAALVGASCLFPLWIAWELSGTFVEDLGPAGLATLRLMIVCLLADTAVVLGAMLAALRSPRVGWWVLAGIVGVGTVAWFALLWLLMAVGPLLRLGSLASAAVQIAGTWLMWPDGRSSR